MAAPHHTAEPDSDPQWERDKRLGARPSRGERLRTTLIVALAALTAVVALVLAAGGGGDPAPDRTGDIATVETLLRTIHPDADVERIGPDGTVTFTAAGTDCVTVLRGDTVSRPLCWEP